MSLFLVREVWVSNPEQINFYHTLSTTHYRCDFDVWPLTQSRGGGNGQLSTVHLEHPKG